MKTPPKNLKFECFTNAMRPVAMIPSLFLNFLNHVEGAPGASLLGTGDTTALHLPTSMENHVPMRANSERPLGRPALAD